MAIYPAINIGHDMAICPAMPLDNKEFKGYFQAIYTDNKDTVQINYSNILPLHTWWRCFTNLPHVFIFATCYSLLSQINQLLRSHGLLSVLNISKERGDITFGKMSLLDEDQKSLLMEIIKNPDTKDVIIGGK